MPDHVELRRGAYYDSVSLMQVSRKVQSAPGVEAAQVAMATDLNTDVIAGMGFTIPDGAVTNDLIVAIRGDEGGIEAGKVALEGALADLKSAGTHSGGFGEAPQRRTLGGAIQSSDANLALISVPGQHATVEAFDAIHRGVSVMLFSDNVPVEDEIRLKDAAAASDVLVMGPDCGTAVVGGVGLGFANATSPGPVGIVAASGTGCQQLLCLLDHAGVGVGSALGVGGRDLSAAVRGASTREALRRLDEDPSVELIVMVSKPPAEEVAAELREYAAGLGTPDEFALLGRGQPDLTAAAEAVLRRLGRDVPDWPVQGAATPSGGRLLRGLFVGGTLCDESMLIATEELGPIRSNIPLSPELGLDADLDAALATDAHTMVDFGDDALTAGRAHPMIDPTLRIDALARAAADSRTGVILLDVVLGHGAEPDPAAALAPVIAAARPPVVACVVGTAADPQDRRRQVAALVEAGAEVHLSNAAATRRAIELLGGTR